MITIAAVNSSLDKAYFSSCSQPDQGSTSRRSERRLSAHGLLDLMGAVRFMEGVMSEGGRITGTFSRFIAPY
ncbi:MAG: hypothetical protein IJS39_00495 [Synergistaceae bacterium]|nr:hypothetical protein [Synergistaceae bacterium]